MKLRRYTAAQFRTPMKRGLNRPFLVLGEAHDGTGRSVLVVKSRAGYANRPEAMLKELFALLLARELGLKVPEPVLVELPAGFDWGVGDHPGHAELIRQSVGWNVGTMHLGESWKPWMQGSPPRSIKPETLEAAYAFDAMVENPDREAENPNMLWRGDELAVLDFDKAFSFLRAGKDDSRPWQKALIRLNLERHSLFPHLSDLEDGKVLGTALWDVFEEWWLGAPAWKISAEIASGFPDKDLDLPQIEVYLKKLAAAPEDFFRYLTDASRPR